MSICVRYFNKEKCNIITDFLGLFLVEEATAEKLYEGLTTYLNKVGLKSKNILAIGTDGANNLCGQRKSLYTLLKNDNSNLILVKCSYHSLHLCCSEASKQFPLDLEFLVREIFNYFNNSPLRSVKYKRVFDLINTGTDSNKFRKLVQISPTRWLSHGLAVKRVLEQWVELKYHFSIIATTEAEKTAQIINRLMIWKKIKEVLDVDTSFLPLDNMDFGCDFENDFNVQIEKSSEIRKTCFLYLKNFVIQMLKRFQTNMMFFKTYKQFSPSICCNPMDQPNFSSIAKILKPVLKANIPIDLYEEQWKKCHL
ncbi:uncharacterized protein LOC124420097 isoform X1 [Lucilia cuprina]|uniref:uncharacterized protein LOC124420097 isoform X1 n=1 Tax=Lucilia cuprina TaxID=7375 RepID=UPI001F0550B7|nr:uncharacterized protein LOC124420097 isoform X1 [Lucilia cuprina]XP_046807905.1 uncharacterized protein LOC124420097 isoform X1 [Lucilia cuprina]XP_046807906.1 uncharacterized protein LOC124420097 isoform X1 [Lucilia cuprina]